jgi:hypothetical protein
MASKVVEDAVQGYLESNWTHLAECPVFTENEEGSIPDDGSAFLRLQFPVANVDRVSPSRGLYRETGGFRIVINVARGNGTATMRAYGEELATLFRDVRIGATVDCRVPSEPFTDDQSDKGIYYQGAMVVPFDRYFTG